MKFRYIGDSDNMTAYGYDFRDGATPDVEDANAINRLSSNRFFEVVETVTTIEGNPDHWPKTEVFNGEAPKKPVRRSKKAQPFQRRK